jgi:hypothetical protein
MLANLDNEVYFKKVFTDIEVFCAFVKDILGIEMHITKVDTEKVLPSKVSAIKFRMDLHAEDKEQRTVVEIQKVDYDYTYDRFTHYFLGNLIDMQRDSKTYKFAKDVYIIVVVTAAYRISDKDGQPIKDDVLVTDINPRTLSGETRDMLNHKMVILNTTNVTKDTPENIRDWLDLIIESMKNPSHPKINTKKSAIKKAAKLAQINNISPEQLAEAKIQEMRKATIALVEDMAKEEAEKKYKIALQKAEKVAAKKLKIALEENANKAKAILEATENKAKQDIIATENKAKQDIIATENKAKQDIIATENKAKEDIIAAENKAKEDIIAAENKAKQDIIAAENKTKNIAIFNALQSGALNKQQIASIFNVSIEYIEQINAQ